MISKRIASAKCCNVFLFILIVALPMTGYAQQKYTEPIKTYKNGAVVETYSNDKLQISVSATIDKVFKNAKEIFFNIIVTPKINNVTLIVDDIKAVGITTSNKEKELEIYDYSSYKAKLKRNLLLWGPNAKQTTTVKTHINVQKNGNATYNYNGNSNVTATTTITEPNPVFYEARRDAEAFAEGYLKSNTVNLGEYINGFIVTKHSKYKEVNLTIPLNGDVYHFSFTLT